MKMKKYDSVDEYIYSFPEDIQKLLQKMRKTIKETAPEAIESMSYGMPGYKFNDKPLVYFAAFKAHIGFYPVPSGLTAFKKELSLYKQGKGSVQFPFDKPLPLDLVKKIVEFRVNENLKSKNN